MAEAIIKPVVAMVGRTNVGKSTLFNRLTEKKQAMVSGIAGTTRDINRGLVEWQGRVFTLVDTGGVDLAHPTEIEKKVLEIVWREVKKADLTLLVVDAKDGILYEDEAIMKHLRDEGVPFIVVANKADSPSLKQAASEFYRLDDEVFPLSASNGSGTGEFLDYLLEKITPRKIEDIPHPEFTGEELKVTFAGLPNVGKSSLLNALLGREEVIVSPEAHTTRESRDTILSYEGQTFKLVDTAGIRKMRKMRKLLLRLSAKKSLTAIQESDWVIMMIDATEQRWGEQDRYIINEIIESGASLIIAANKWDLLEGEDRHKLFMERWRRQFHQLGWVPIVPVSAKNGWHVNKLLDKIIELKDNRTRELPQSALDRLLKAAIKKRRPIKKKGPEAPYVHTIKQLGTAPPAFEVIIDFKDTLNESYRRFLIKMLREKFNFEGTPVKMYIRSIK